METQPEGGHELAVKYVRHGSSPRGAQALVDVGASIREELKAVEQQRKALDVVALRHARRVGPHGDHW